MKTAFIFPRTIRSHFSKLLLGTLLSTTTAIYAETIIVLDQNNRPVQDAIISLPDTASNTLPEAIPAVAIMDQINKQFVPKVLTILKGQSVSFPNSDDIRHHVYSFSAPKTFELKLYSGTPTAPITFDQPGIVVLGCNIHDSMVGYIYVAENTSAVQTDANGRAELPALSSSLYVWHPDLQGNRWMRREATPELNPATKQWEIKVSLDNTAAENSERNFKSGFKKRSLQDGK